MKDRILVECPACHADSSIALWLLGRRGSCPHCAAQFRAEATSARVESLPTQSQRDVVRCPGCQTEYGMALTDLGRVYRCRECEVPFRAKLARPSVEQLTDDSDTTQAGSPPLQIDAQPSGQDRTVKGPQADLEPQGKQIEHLQTEIDDSTGRQLNGFDRQEDHLARRRDRLKRLRRLITERGQDLDGRAEHLAKRDERAD